MSTADILTPLSSILKLTKLACMWTGNMYACSWHKAQCRKLAFLSPGSEVGTWTAEWCLYTKERKQSGSFLLLLAGASLWKSHLCVNYALDIMCLNKSFDLGPGQTTASLFPVTFSRVHNKMASLIPARYFVS